MVTKPPRELAARCESMPFIRSGGRRRYGVRHRSRGNSEVTVVMLFTPPKLTVRKPPELSVVKSATPPERTNMLTDDDVVGIGPAGEMV